MQSQARTVCQLADAGKSGSWRAIAIGLLMSQNDIFAVAYMLSLPVLSLYWLLCSANLFAAHASLQHKVLTL
jgi:hypothetical protein